MPSEFTVFPDTGVDVPGNCIGPLTVVPGTLMVPLSARTISSIVIVTCSPSPSVTVRPSLMTEPSLITGSTHVSSSTIGTPSIGAPP